MQKSLIILTVLMLVLASASQAVYMAGFNSSGGSKITVKGQFIVRFDKDAQISGVSGGSGMFRLGLSSIDKIFEDYKVDGVRPLFRRAEAAKDNRLNRFYVINIPDNMDDKAFIQRMNADPNIVSVENDVACEITATPNDELYVNQWHLYQPNRKDIHAQEGWNIEQGNDSIVIAIIDTGVNYLHEDLRHNIWVNPGEDIDGDEVVYDSTDINGVDDDGNGYTDDLIGYDFVAGTGTYWPGEDGNTKDNDPNDFNGHGTHCAGIAAAVSNNAVGVAGVAGGWGEHYYTRGVRIMCLRAGYSGPDPVSGHETGYLLNSATAEAMEYAAANGADIISYSAGSSPTTALTTATADVINAGILMFTSAGNNGSSNDEDYFDSRDSLITVAWTDQSDNKDPDSDYGLWVEIAAPGSDILSTYSLHYTPTYAYLSGTSMATPCAAGVAALIKSHYPDMTMAELYEAVLSSADPLTGETYYDAGLLGSGRVNAYNYLQNAPVAEFSGGPLIGKAPLTVNFTDESPAATSWNWDFGDGNVSMDPNPSNEYSEPGLYTVSLQIDDPNGSQTKTKKRYIYAIGDTLYSDTVIADVYQSFPIPIKIKNLIPLKNLYLVFNYNNFQYDSFTIAGTVSEDFYYFNQVAQYQTRVAYQGIAYHDNGTNYLMPGEHTIFNIWVTGSGGIQAIDTATLSSKSTTVGSAYFDEYVPLIKPMVVDMGIRGDANDDKRVNIVDASYLVNYIFFGGPDPRSGYCGDANGDFSVNIVDASYLINYIFFGGNPPPP